MKNVINRMNLGIFGSMYIIYNVMDDNGIVIWLMMLKNCSEWLNPLSNDG